MTTTRKFNLYKKMLEVRNHGFALKKNKNKIFYNWKHQLNSNGYNFRLNDIQSYLGLNQMKKLNKFVKSRNKISKFTQKNLKIWKNILFSKTK